MASTKRVMLFYVWSCEKMQKKRINWKPEVDVDRGLKQTIEYFKKII